MMVRSPRRMSRLGLIEKDEMSCPGPSLSTSNIYLRRHTFLETGFYKTLQRRAEKVLRLTGTGPDWRSKLVQDTLTGDNPTIQLINAHTPWGSQVVPSAPRNPFIFASGTHFSSLFLYYSLNYSLNVKFNLDYINFFIRNTKQRSFYSKI